MFRKTKCEETGSRLAVFVLLPVVVLVLLTFVGCGGSGRPISQALIRAMRKVAQSEADDIARAWARNNARGGLNANQLLRELEKNAASAARQQARKDASRRFDSELELLCMHEAKSPLIIIHSTGDVPRK